MFDEVRENGAYFDFIESQSHLLDRVCDTLEKVQEYIVDLSNQLSKVSSGSGSGSGSSKVEETKRARQLAAELERAEKLYALVYDYGKRQADTISTVLRHSDQVLLQS